MVNGGAVARVAAQEGGVRAVQGGDHARLEFRGKHVPGENGRGGMGHGVVHVQDIQFEVPAHLRHAHGEGQRIIRIFKQPIMVDGDGMEMQARLADGQAERAFVADEMHLVAAPGQFLAQGGGQNAAAAHGGVAGDADF